MWDFNALSLRQQIKSLSHDLVPRSSSISKFHRFLLVLVLPHFSLSFVWFSVTVLVACLLIIIVPRAGTIIMCVWACVFFFRISFQNPSCLFTNDAMLLMANGFHTTILQLGDNSGECFRSTRISQHCPS